MNKIKVELTEDQLETIRNLISEKIFDKAFKGQSEYVAFLSRLNKTLAKAKS
jgi:hypothetical protein